mgnify:CR=1 FL=1
MQIVQYGNTGHGKCLCTGSTYGHRHFKYKIGTASKCHFCTQMFGKESRSTALDEITAHGADDSGIAAVLPPDGLHQKRMAIMQGIIFCYDTSGFHICHLKAVTK